MVNRWSNQIQWLQNNADDVANSLLDLRIAVDQLKAQIDSLGDQVDQLKEAAKPKRRGRVPKQVPVETRASQGVMPDFTGGVVTPG